MANREKVIKGLECCKIPFTKCYNGGCPYFENDGCKARLKGDALALLKEQEPRVMTAEDFIDNPDADSEGFLPVWVEYRRDGEWAEYWDDTADEWSTADGIRGDGYRFWTSRPTDEQRQAVKWV